VRRLEQFHLRCLRSIAGIRRQDRITNVAVLDKCGITGIEAFLLQAQFRWIGHVIRMPDTRIPKQDFFGQLATWQPIPGRPSAAVQRLLRKTCERANIDPREVRRLPYDRVAWRARCLAEISGFEENRTNALDAERQARKTGNVNTATSWTCDVCQRLCTSRIGLFAHRGLRRNRRSNPECVCARARMVTGAW